MNATTRSATGSAFELDQFVQFVDQRREVFEGTVRTGCGFSMSTPASRSRSSGNFEQPPLRKLR